MLSLIHISQVDADKVDEVIALIKAYQPDLVMNIALPYQDLTIMDACLACGVNYMDTANYEPEKMCIRDRIPAKKLLMIKLMRLWLARLMPMASAAISSSCLLYTSRCV